MNTDWFDPNQSELVCLRTKLRQSMGVYQIARNIMYDRGHDLTGKDKCRPGQLRAEVSQLIRGYFNATKKLDAATKEVQRLEQAPSAI